MERAETIIHKAVVVRVEPGEDLIPALIEAAAGAHVKEALISPILGSLEQIRLVLPVGREEGRILFSDPLEHEGPVEIVGGGGFLCRNEAEAPEVHLHLLVCLASGEVVGGHVLPRGNPVLATVECGLLVPSGVHLVRRKDPLLGVPVLHPEARRGQHRLLHGAHHTRRSVRTGLRPVHHHGLL